MLRAILWGLATTWFFWQGLEVAGWGFYELCHATGVESLYFGYSLLRGLDHFVSLWAYYEYFCVSLGGCVASIILYFARKQGNS